MREIEFRAISRETKKMVHGLLIHNTYECELQIMETVEIHFIHPINLETLGQYTGLKDKNGEKIFEGDIIKGYESTPLGVCEYLATVIFKNGSFMLSINHKTYNEENEIHFYEFVINDENKIPIEVIGNIHQNPELLK